MKREASPFRYDELAGAAATDWGTFKDEGERTQGSVVWVLCTAELPVRQGVLPTTQRRRADATGAGCTT